jgi:hypothetical protein
MAAQSYANHAHRPTAFVVGVVLVLVALVEFGRRWSQGGGRTEIGLLALTGAVMAVLYTSRAYTTRLQDRIIRLEMRVRGQSLLSQEQQQLLSALSVKQVVALRFASDAELPALIDRAAREKLAPTDIKRAITIWVPDLDRT